MKKSKYILAIALAFVLLITFISAPTFSWFTRPQSKSGEEMLLNSKNAYSAYNGKNVTITTYPSANGFDYSTASTKNYSGSGVYPHNRKYYCTTITNNSGSDQNVSLYANKLSIPTSNTNGTLAIGVNGPTRNYRDYSSLAEPKFTTTNNTMRIYFEKDNSVTGWNGTDFYICYNEDPNTGVESLNSTGSNGTYYQMKWVGDAGHPNHFYADIPRTATHAFFAVANWGTNNNNSPDYSQRSQTLWNLAGDGQAWNTPKLYKITSTLTNGNRQVVKYSSPGVGVDQYYSSISLAAGNTYTTDAIMDSSWFIGGSRKYYTNNPSVFTVDENTGSITTVSAGEATLYTKVINSSNGYWDAYQVETTIKVTEEGNYEFKDVPIVRNILIPGSGGSQEDPANVVKVYWYVINNSDSNNLSYTIDNLYIGL